MYFTFLELSGRRIQRMIRKEPASGGPFEGEGLSPFNPGFSQARGTAVASFEDHLSGSSLMTRFHEAGPLSEEGPASWEEFQISDSDRKSFPRMGDTSFPFAPPRILG
jgi:hypothetical protein